MKIHDLVISTVLATTAIDGHTSNPPDTMHTVEAVSANIERLCEDPAIQAKIMHPEDVCQVSLDDGKTWINVTEALLALILAGSATYMIRRRKIKDDGSAPETEPTGDGSAPETEPTGDGSAPERQEKVILEPEPDT